MATQRHAQMAAAPDTPTPRGAARRDDLIAACLRSLAARGREGASVRRIAAEAGVSVGLIHHYFPSVDDLVAAAYRRIAGRLSEDIEAEVAKARTPTARLEAFIATSLASPAVEASALNAWLTFWSMIRGAPAVKAAHDETYGAYRARLQTILVELAGDVAEPDFDVSLVALGLTAMLDGLWLEHCLNPRALAKDEALALGRAYVAGLTRPSAR